jgi:ribosomal-protein-serine acetyltransferase
MDTPLLLDVPEEIRTQRLFLRAPRIGDGATVFPTARDSMAELKAWMPWASDAYSLDDAEKWCRSSAARFTAREMFHFLIFEGDSHVGNIGLFKFDWAVPRCEIGYWLATSRYGNGLMSEAVERVATLTFEVLKVERLELRCDERNDRSARVAARCGFQIEGVLRHESRGTDGELRNSRVYSMLRPIVENR